MFVARRNPWFWCFSNNRHRAISTSLRWGPLDELEDATVHRFNVHAFAPAKPTLFPSGYFRLLPAIGKWFSPAEKGGAQTRFNQAYMSKFENAFVPLELTRASVASDQGPRDDTFQRAEAPLKIFLAWAAQATSESQDRIYLAQASFRDLPQDLTEDLPVPSIVSEVGKGHLYDTNIWLGVSPTCTPLHRDPNPNLFVQLAGSKVIRLLAPQLGQAIFHQVQEALGKKKPENFRGDEMMKGEEHSLLESAIWKDLMLVSAGSFSGFEVHLSAGDGVFIPKGWWHSVKGIGTGVTGSVSADFA